MCSRLVRLLRPVPERHHERLLPPGAPLALRECARSCWRRRRLRARSSRGGGLGAAASLRRCRRRLCLRFRLRRGARPRQSWRLGGRQRLRPGGVGALAALGQAPARPVGRARLLSTPKSAPAAVGGGGLIQQPLEILAPAFFGPCAEPLLAPLPVFASPGALAAPLVAPAVRAASARGEARVAAAGVRRVVADGGEDVGRLRFGAQFRQPPLEIQVPVLRSGPEGSISDGGQHLAGALLRDQDEHGARTHEGEVETLLACEARLPARPDEIPSARRVRLLRDRQQVGKALRKVAPSWRSLRDAETLRLLELWGFSLGKPSPGKRRWAQRPRSGENGSMPRTRRWAQRPGH